MFSSARRNSSWQTDELNAFSFQIRPILGDMVRHMDDLESTPGCLETLTTLVRAWRSLEKGGAMFGFELVAQMAGKIRQSLDFYLCLGKPVPLETITLSRKIRLRVLGLLN